jgi:hypothetical protein
MDQSYPIHYNTSADADGYVSIRIQTDFADLNGSFVERCHVTQLAPRLKVLRKAARSSATSAKREDEQGLGDCVHALDEYRAGTTVFPWVPTAAGQSYSKLDTGEWFGGGERLDSRALVERHGIALAASVPR